MGLMIPGELANLLNDLGYTWPKTDEEKLFQLGQHWMDHGGKVGTVVQDASGAAGKVWGGNQGDAIEAFRAKWEHDKSALKVVQNGQTGAQVIGAALFVCAGIVLALKINVIVQLTILLIEIIEAIATAAPTFGASLLEIPVFKKIADMAINLIINEAMGAILG
jgi:SH3-like domain-containing protein